MPENNFFAEQTEQSLVKTTIVAKYFDAWALVITATQDRNPRLGKKIAYIDLFAGPGHYDDGTVSTPLKIIEKAIKNQKYRERIVCMFNDKDENNVKSLENTIATIQNIKSLKYQPEIFNQEVGTEIVKMFEKMQLVPTLFFVDPWGYKGLSLRLINSVLKDWGCDCIFFFNYNRINMGINNNAVKQHIESLFGIERSKNIQIKLESATSSTYREIMVIEELCAALKDMGGKFILPFRFRAQGGKRTSHHLIFVSKNFKGYEIMKEVMAKESSNHDEGVASFEYNPIDRSKLKQGLLFKLTQPIGDLGKSILNKFAGREIKTIDIYKEHSVDTPYIKRNYKDALMQLEQEEKIIVDKHKKNTFGDNISVKFLPS
jgi:three-Cys-motif partner protein